MTWLWFSLCWFQEEIDDDWGDDVDDELPVHDPFIYKAKDGSQVLVAVQEQKEVKLPNAKKKGGCDDWKLSFNVETKKWILLSETSSTTVPARRFEHVLATKLVTDFTEESRAEMTRHIWTKLRSVQ